MASFYQEQMDVDCHDVSREVDVDKLREEFVDNYKAGNVNMKTNPIMRQFCDTGYCDANRYTTGAGSTSRRRECM